MKLRRLFGSLLCGLLLTGAGLFAADAASEAAGKAADGAASAAVGTQQVVTPIVQHARGTEFVEFLVNKVLVLAGETTSDSNTLLRYGISALFLVLGFLLRKVITNIVFAVLKRFASKTETTLDDKLFHALETPMATFVFVLGMVCSVKALVLSADADRYVGYLTTVVFSLLLFWGLLKAFNTILDHMHEAAKERELGIAAFMPLIKKVLIAIFIIFGGLLIAQSLGADVKAFLAGLGIGGLAFALAAQDTIANLFGSLVVALDQPFKVGEVVRIGGHEGKVEDIGLRSTKIRTAGRLLIAIPNKSVAGEAITNFSRMPQRRVDQTIGLTYNTTPEQMEAVLGDIRKILTTEPEVHPEVVVVNFSGFGASSLDVQIVYFASNPDWIKHMELRERINLKIMRAVSARGLSMAFPTQTVQLDGDVARKLAGMKA